MAKVIYKYPLHVGQHATVELPVGYAICDIAVQNGEAFIWAIHDEVEEPETENLKLRIFGTGDPIPDGLTFLKTIHMPPYVWHIFEKE